MYNMHRHFGIPVMYVLGAAVLDVAVAFLAPLSLLWRPCLELGMTCESSHVTLFASVLH